MHVNTSTPTRLSLLRNSSTQVAYAFSLSSIICRLILSVPFQIPFVYLRSLNKRNLEEVTKCRDR